MAPQVIAESLRDKIQDAKEKKATIKDQRTDLKTDISEKQGSIEELHEEQRKLNMEAKRLDLAIAETKTNIRVKESEIADTELEISKLGEEIDELSNRIAKRDDLLKNRVRSVQQNGGVVSYLDVLLGAKSFSDFLDRVGSVSIIVQQDKLILKKHIEEKETLESKKQEVTNLLGKLEGQLGELETLQSTLEVQRKEKDVLIAQLKEQENQIEEDILAIEEEDEILSKQEAAMSKLVKQLEEQERKRLEAIKNGKKPPITDGTFMRPTNGPVTSNYGQRWGKLHAGIDIGKRGKDVPVVAVADGIVFRSYYSATYGNVVFITHNVKGQIYTSVYAHLENREVAEGDAVTKGKQLGFMGNTGRSFGAHLHFELHKGPWNVGKTNSVDPKKHIDF